jgi:hypothetical protein
MNVSNAFRIINSLSKTYPLNHAFEFSLMMKVTAGDNRHINGTHWSLTVFDDINNPKQYNPKSGP